jgi:hypothetical protein
VNAQPQVGGGLPHVRDQLSVYGQTFFVQGEPERRDPDQLVWTLDVTPA